MTRYATKDCDCPDVITGTGGKRPDRCVCGNRFQTEAELRSVGVGAARDGDRTEPDFASFNGSRGVDSSTPKPRRRSTLKRTEPRRDWGLANAKREEEGDCCRVTGEAGTELAHILGRKYDEPISPGSKTLLVLPDRVVPLAPRIHTAYDRKEFDLLPYLTAAEQAQAVLDAGSMGLALKRISPMLEMAA